MNETNYFSRSWALLTRDKGWIKPLLVMAAAALVPIAGYLGNQGYALEWARLSAWGVDSVPKQKNVDIGKCIASGFRGFVVSIGWGLVLMIVNIIINVIYAFFPDTAAAVIASIVSIPLMVLGVIWSVVIAIAKVRCAIYESIGAGYRPDRVFELIRRDTNGFVKLCLANFLCSFVIGIVSFLFVVIVMVMFTPFVIGVISEFDDAQLISLLAGSIVWLLPLCVLFGYAISFVANAMDVLILNAVGLWMRQFNVPGWGRSEDPLP